MGIEMSAELKLVQPATRVTLVHSHEKLLSNEALPDECKDRAMELLLEAGVEVKMGKRLAETTPVPGEGKQLVRFEDGETMEASVVIKAVSAAVPNSAFLPKEAYDSQGFVLVKSNMMFVPGGVPNAEAHFAVGDVIRWSGIKRCGGAMHMGYFAAHNIHELILERMTGATPKFNELGEIPPMIGLAVGKKAVSYGPEQGVASGEDVMKAFFGNDLGFGSKYLVSLDCECSANVVFSLLEVDEVGRKKRRASPSTCGRQMKNHGVIEAVLHGRRLCEGQKAQFRVF